MKTLLCCSLLLAGIPAFCQEKNIAGTWEGNITPQVRLVFHFTQTNNSISGAMDSPDQGVTGLSLSNVILQGDSVIAAIQPAKASYKAVFSNDSTLSGYWQQGNISLPLIIKKTGNAQTARARQTPVPPFPYRSDSVTYTNADNSVRFGATFTRPFGNKPYAAVILLSGSGSQDRDETIGQHKPFAVIADYLTRRGIAVLRVDDRGMGLTTTGNLDQLTSETLAGDVEAGIRYLQQRSDVNKQKIGLIGHSEGGMIAPMLAARRRDIAFIVLLAGPGIPGDRIIQQQFYHSYIRKGLPGTDEARAEALINQVLNAVKQDTVYENIQTGIQQAYNNWKKDIPDSTERRLLYTYGSTAYLNFAAGLKRSHGIHWFHYFLNYNPAINLSKVRCPVLALNGEKDRQVAAAENIPAIAAALKKGQNKHYETNILPGLNHLFQTCNQPEDAYSSLPETFSPAALQLIGDWIVNTVQ